MASISIFWTYLVSQTTGFGVRVKLRSVPHCPRKSLIFDILTQGIDWPFKNIRLSPSQPFTLEFS